MFIGELSVSTTNSGTTHYGAILGAILQLVGYAFLSPAGPFPLMCTGFCFAGFGISLQNAQGNGFVGGYKENTSTMLGFLHASYGMSSD